MSILNEIHKSLEGVAKVQETNNLEDVSTGSTIIQAGDIKSIQKRIEKVLIKHAVNGEKITSHLDKGSIEDCGKEYFKILEGYLTEFYNYSSLTSLIIRNYRISDGLKEWIAVYIDENIKSPWWDEDERLGLI